MRFLAKQERLVAPFYGGEKTLFKGFYTNFPPKGEKGLIPIPPKLCRDSAAPK